MKNKNLYLVGILIAFFLGVGGTVLLLDNTTIGKEKIIAWQIPVCQTDKAPSGSKEYALLPYRE